MSSAAPPLDAASATLAAFLRGEDLRAREDDAPALLEAIELHGIGPLVFHLNHERGDDGGLPAVVMERAAAMARAEAAVELHRAREVRALLDDLAQAGVRPVLMKGTALAYQVYPSPALRPRGDTDLLIDRRMRRTAMEVLAARGYDRALTAGGETAVTQFCFEKSDEAGIGHCIDLHWRLANTPVLADAFGWEEAWKDRERLDALGPNALSLGKVHALLFACLHRIKHRHAPYTVGERRLHEPDRLLWLYDLRLLSEALAQAEWRDFLALASRSGHRAICRHGLDRAVELVGAKVPPEVLAALAAPGAPELSAGLTHVGRAGALWLDLRALSWGGRVRWLREVLFPPSAYMRQRFHGSGAPLAWLHVRRLVGGIRKKLTPRDRIL